MRAFDGMPRVETNPRWIGYRCGLCAREYEIDPDRFVCDSCGVNGILDVVYNGNVDRREAAIRGDHSLWRFRRLLPVIPQAPHAAWTLGGTPLVAAPRLAARLDVAELLLKDDTGLPSASLKDRAAAVALARARQLQRDHMSCASTGNAAASLAVLTARAGVRCTIFVPAAAPPAKLAQLALHGAHVVRVDGSYDEAFDLSLNEIETHGWYSRNCAHNPLLVEGKKTAALELAADLTADFTRGDASLPDAVFVPTGDGCIVAATAKAFLELYELGLTGSVPQVFGIQAEGAAPLARAWTAAGPQAAALEPAAVLAAVTPVAARTLADSISVGVPRNRLKAWSKVAATGGGFHAVSDAEIVAAVAQLAALAGVFAEPSAAAGLAGLAAARASGLVAADARVAVLVTGHGLKDPTAALDGLSPCPAADPESRPDGPR